MSSDAKQGPLSVQDLLGIWQNAVDRGYQEPLQAAGEGRGFEAYTQMLAQLARVSQAVDVTTQALYVRPWSGQTNPPAGGAGYARVQLTFSATKYVERPIRIAAGTLYVDERVNDWGPNGSVAIATGRRYLVLQDVVFFPGDTGPVTVTAVAERPGYGYNNPRPNTIVLLDQPGSGYYHDRGTVTLAPQSGQPPPSYGVTLTAVNEPDTFIPDHVGQYVQFTAGANAGLIGRVTSYQGPNPATNNGGSVALENLVSLNGATNPPVAFLPGDQVVLKRTMGTVVTGYGTFVASRVVLGVTRYMLVLTSVVAGSGVLDASTDTIVRLTDALSDTLLPTSVQYAVGFAAEAPPTPATAGSGANWRVLDWAQDVGLTATNAASPTGGVAALLDAIGAERNVPRANGEADSSYRERVGNVADTTTPNAVRRAIARVLGSIPFCFREVGSSALPGVYYDRAGDPFGDYYDLDTLTAFTTGLTGAQPVFEEPFEYRNAAGDVLMRGWVGDPNPFVFFGGSLLLIRRSGAGTLSNPLKFAAGDRVFFLTGGGRATLSDPNITTHTYTNLGTLKPNSVYFDYTTFRAYFRVGVPRLGFGEFGFAFGALPAGSANDPRAAYDSAPYLSFYDGYAVGASSVYRQVWSAIDKTRAAGTSFDLYQEDGSCP